MASATFCLFQGRPRPPPTSSPSLAARSVANEWLALLRFLYANDWRGINYLHTTETPNLSNLFAYELLMKVSFLMLHGMAE